jgi:hypothetical protein
LLCAAIVGFDRLSLQLSSAELKVPEYSRWSRGDLHNHVAALEDDLDKILNVVVQFGGGRKRVREVARWLM